MDRCLKIPGSFWEINSIIIQCSGVENWRPLFLLGLGTLLVLVFITGGLVIVVRRIT